MEYRRFGKTELKMPVLTAGGMRFQASWNAAELDRITDEGQANVAACLRRALDEGITHFETARGYGTSETQVGRAMRELPREQILLQTKIGPTETGEEFAAHFEESLERLQTDYVDLLAIHGINRHETLAKTLRADGCLEMAEQLKADGRVRHVGFSSHGPTDVIVATIATDRFEYANLHWFWIQQEKWPAIAAAAERDMGVLIISPNDKGGRLWEPSTRLVELCEPFAPMTFNDLFCLRRDEVNTLSIGTRRPEDFDIHLQAVARLGDPAAAEQVCRIDERLSAEFRDVLGAEYCRTWHEGLPEWPDTPGEVNVPFIVWLHNLATVLDVKAFCTDRYGLLGNAGDWVPGKPLGETDPAELADAVAASPHAARIMEILAEAHEMFAGTQGKRLQAEE
jgi:predicted aldo/keto reductase-like oxidoreductase